MALNSVHGEQGARQYDCPKMNMNTLEPLLRRRGHDNTGKKSSLIARLVERDTNITVESSSSATFPATTKPAGKTTAEASSATTQCATASADITQLNLFRSLDQINDLKGQLQTATMGLAGAESELRVTRMDLQAARDVFQSAGGELKGFIEALNHRRDDKIEYLKYQLEQANRERDAARAILRGLARNKSTSGEPPKPSSGLFGFQPSSGGLALGSQPNPGGFGSGSKPSSGLSGSNLSATLPVLGGGLFGSSSEQRQDGGLFGNKPVTGGIFGSTTSGITGGGLFGNTQQSQQTQTTAPVGPNTHQSQSGAFFHSSIPPIVGRPSSTFGLDFKPSSGPFSFKSPSIDFDSDHFSNTVGSQLSLSAADTKQPSGLSGSISLVTGDPKRPVTRNILRPRSKKAGKERKENLGSVNDKSAKETLAMDGLMSLHLNTKKTEQQSPERSDHESRNNNGDTPRDIKLAYYKHTAAARSQITSSRLNALSPADIPAELRCSICSGLAVDAFELPCCERQICGTCQLLFPGSCIFCTDTPVSNFVIERSSRPVKKEVRLAAKNFIIEHIRKGKDAVAILHH